jgi:unsaturated rhamnogalacturonyl hydrolase
MKSFVAALGLLATSSFTSAADSFSDWPAGKSPKEIGTRVTNRFIASPHQNFGKPQPPGEITYPEVCTWWGALTFSKLAEDKALTGKLIERFLPLFGAESRLVPKPVHVDPSVFGSVPLEIYQQIGEKPYLNLGLHFADRQWQRPSDEAYQKLSPEARGWVDQGLSWQTRLWIDDMFMITMLQAQAFRATGDAKYIDCAASEMVFYLDELQRPNGLFFHAPDVPFFWGRGNGWMAAGTAELLRALPEKHQHRARIMEGYRKMMERLLATQAENGMWRQLVDDPESWTETSCTGMFTFAFITGVKHGWLPAETYGPAARRGWLALTDHLNENADIRDVCQGTNKTNDREFYLKRARLTGDMHGQAPVLWCASALLR